ncbi:MAG TPA: SH3 domain-containing protein [Roseiflexaceae bacterium]
MDSATEKLELGLQRLAKAGDDADLLGLALQSIHGALEDHFRARLAADGQVPAEQRAAVLDPKRVQWKELLDMMRLYGDLSTQDAELIWRTNGLRTKVAHGGRYSLTRAEVECYAALVQSLCGYARPLKPAAPAAAPARPAAEKPARPPTSVRQESASPERARAERSPTAQPRARPRAAWLGVLLALVLLVGLAAFVVLRSAAQPLVDAAASTSGAPATAQEAAGAEATPAPHSATVVAPDGLNLRKDHSRAADRLVALPNGARVTVVGGPIQADGFTWWKVEVGGQSGWCAGEFLRFD